MAKKKSALATPQVSNLPLPKSDTPLVIDLPDGQKLVVGKMQTGTVIEVATWRGTGRPDSRTNRMMLGVSVAGQSSAAPSDTSANSAANGSSPTSTPGSKNKFDVQAILQGLLTGVTKFINQILASLKNRKPKAKPAAPVTSSDSTPKIGDTIAPKPVEKLSSEAEIDEWLNKVKEKRAARIAKEAGLSTKKPAQKSKNQKKKK